MLQNTVIVLIIDYIKDVQATIFIMNNLTSLQRDLLFQSLNLVLHTKLEKLDSYKQEQFYDMYKKLAKTYPSIFHSQNKEVEV
tara:strand:- start:529 stop:777 length:249 start_codon:yes stop_codon:yes gene_type:complete